MNLNLPKATRLFLLLGVLLIQVVSAQTGPEFLPGEDPRPFGQQWVLVPEMSDDFDGGNLDPFKWQNTDPSRWIGRPPGIFKTDTVSVADGNLRITNYELEEPEWHGGNLFTHAGGHVISRQPGQIGYYYEARMKANKTFMSSTFWLINYRNLASGCDRRVTELDIQECVGQVTSTAGWAQNFDESMHSNTHSRNVVCGDPVGSRGGNVPTGGKVWDDYHTYGAWWKNPNEILFFLDGELVYSVEPVANFDLEMYIKLVTETYDWNPVPSGGGMDGTWEERTTSYDWVRTWRLSETGGNQLLKLADVYGNVDAVSFNPETKIPSQTSYTITVHYTASQTRDIVLEFWDDGWIDSERVTVKRGSSSVDITMNLNNAPPPGDNYLWKASVRPVGTDWTSNLDLVEQGGIVVTE